MGVVGVSSWTLGWAVAVKALDSCPTLALEVSRSSWRVLGSSSLPSSLLGVYVTHWSPWAPSSRLLSPSTVSRHLRLLGPRARGPRGPVISGSHHLHLASVILGTAPPLHHCGPGHHPCIICLPSIILASGLPLAARALYMVGFHSFVCTFGEGLLCARPCARQQVMDIALGSARLGDTHENRRMAERLGPGQLGDVGQRRGALTAVGQGVGGSAKVLPSGVWKERSQVLSFNPAGGRHLRNGAGNPGPPSLFVGSSFRGPGMAPCTLRPPSASASLPWPLLTPPGSARILGWSRLTLSRW